VGAPLAGVTHQSTGRRSVPFVKGSIRSRGGRTSMRGAAVALGFLLPVTLADAQYLSLRRTDARTGGFARHLEALSGTKGWGRRFRDPPPTRRERRSRHARVAGAAQSRAHSARTRLASIGLRCFYYGRRERRRRLPAEDAEECRRDRGAFCFESGAGSRRVGGHVRRRLVADER
jgi:hypothetical protein